MTGQKPSHPEKKEECGVTAEIGSPLPKFPDPDDPMGMEAELVSGDPRVMLDCLIEEFARLGWDANRIARMFENPFFLASHGLAERFGFAAIRERIRQTLKRCGVFSFEIIEETPDQRPGSESSHDNQTESGSDF